MKKLNHFKISQISQSFFSTFCGAPVVPKIVPLTREMVIEHFTLHIQKVCNNQVTVVKYSMPKEFYGRISVDTFWEIICSFLRNEMKFTNIVPNYYSTGLLFESDYNSIPFNHFYCVSQKQSSHHGEYFMQDYNCKIGGAVNFVVFRIYKA